MPDTLSDNLPVIHDNAGTPRVLAALPPREDYGGFPRFASANPIIPRDQWRECDLSSFAGPVWDQGQHGSCVGHGSAKAFEVAYRIGGGTVPPSGFSPTSLYALVNGGRDAGAVVSDAMDALINRGVATMDLYPESVVFDRQLPAATLARVEAARARFKVAEAFHCATFDAIASALQYGFPVSFGIVIRGGFNAVGADGVIPEGGFPLGGHCMCAVGLASLSGAWAIKVLNSWGASFGAGGFCYLTEWHFAHGGQLDAFAIRADQSDPADPDPAPVVLA